MNEPNASLGDTSLKAVSFFRLTTRFKLFGVVTLQTTVIPAAFEFDNLFGFAGRHLHGLFVVLFELLQDPLLDPLLIEPATFLPHNVPPFPVPFPVPCPSIPPAHPEHLRQVQVNHMRPGMEYFGSPHPLLLQNIEPRVVLGVTLHRELLARQVVIGLFGEDLSVRRRRLLFLQARQRQFGGQQDYPAG